MYSPRIVAAKIEAALKLRRIIAEPRYYSRDECMDRSAVLEGAIKRDDEGNSLGLGRDLTQDEINFIRDQRFLCRIDFRYWASRYAWIKNEEDRVVAFVPWPSQQIYLDVLAEHDEQRIAIMLQILKARQLGISRVNNLAGLHRVVFFPHISAMLASSSPDKTRKLAEMFLFPFVRLPWWMVPKITYMQDSDSIRVPASLLDFRDWGSGVDLQHGSQMTGIARGTTPTVACISELCIGEHTLIRCEDGRLTEIKDIRVADRVLGSDGLHHRVKRKAMVRRSDRAVSVYQWGTPFPVTLTADHRVLTQRGWIEAGCLTMRDRLCHPIRPLTSQRTAASFWKPGVGRSSPDNGKTVSVDLTESLGFLCGLYLAEGHLHPSSCGSVDCVTFSCDRAEECAFVDELSRAYPTARITVIRSKNSRTSVLRMYCSGLAQWLDREFGHVDTKTIPDWVWDAPSSFGTGIIRGYLMGDGHIPDHKLEIFVSSIRPAILYQLRDLMASLGYGWAGLYYREAGEFYGRTCQAIHTIQICGETAFRLRQQFGWKTCRQYGKTRYFELRDGFVQVAIRRLQSGGAKRYYDIEVESDRHDFVTVGGIVHNCEFEDGGELIDASLLRAMHDSEKTFLILESTALGQYNWWHRKWLSSKAGWPEGRSRLRPQFLPWFVGGLYPKEVWLRARPIPADYVPAPWCIHHAERARAYVQSNTLLTRHLGSNWIMPKEQMWFYEVERGEAHRENRLSKFLAEMPSSDDEAFQSTNISVFSTEVISSYRDQTGKRNPIGVYGLEGPVNLLHPRFAPHHTLHDPDQPPIHLKYDWGMGAPVPFTLRPLRWEGWPNDSGLDKVYLWEKPEDGEVYGLGYDTSDGIEKDRTTIEILRKGTPWRKAGQVGEFCSAKLNALDGLPFLMALGAMFSVRNEEGRIVQPRMAIECKGNGDQTQLKLQLLGWHNFHPWLKPDNRKIDRNRYHKIGIFTNSWFRAGMLEYVIKMLRDDEMEIWSPMFVEEMQSLEGDDFRQSLKAAAGGHDDRIMALGFVIISLYQYERNREIIAKMEKPPRNFGERMYARWSPSAQEQDGYGQEQQLAKLNTRAQEFIRQVK